jgi:hypothetical protein
MKSVIARLVAFAVFPFIAGFTVLLLVGTYTVMWISILFAEESCKP